jgi:hypothetical protein
LYLVSADGNQYLEVNCNLNSRNGDYSGAWFGHTDRGNGSGSQKSTLLMRSPSVDTWYVIKYVIDGRGIGSVSIEDRQGDLLANQSQLFVGTGPFFAVLAHWAG